MDRISDHQDDPRKVAPHDSETNMDTMAPEKSGADIARGDLIELDSADAVLAAKMHLLNEVRTCLSPLTRPNKQESC